MHCYGAPLAARGLAIGAFRSARHRASQVVCASPHHRLREKSPFPPSPSRTKANSHNYTCPTAEGDKKFLSRDEEPEEYWSSKSERAGNNPLSDPLAVIGILAIFFPFILLLVAGATGFIDFR